jgi:TonB family protein
VPERPTSAASEVTPPRAIKQVRPLVAKEVAEIIHREVVVPVHLMIDAKGKVITAEAPASSSTLERLLGKIAVETARMWRFEPARSGGRAIPASMDLQFKFGPHR